MPLKTNATKQKENQQVTPQRTEWVSKILVPSSCGNAFPLCMISATHQSGTPSARNALRNLNCMGSPFKKIR